jgi:hypothetical protein
MVTIWKLENCQQNKLILEFQGRGNFSCGISKNVY